MTDLQQAESRLAKLIEDMSGSIQAEVATVEAKLDSTEAKMEAGFERVETATRRNTGTLAGGAAAIAALNRWAARCDTADRKRDSAIHSLESRVRKLERSSKKRK